MPVFHIARVRPLVVAIALISGFTTTLRAQVVVGGGARIEGSGNVVSETREVGDFSLIEVNNAIKLSVTIGPEASVEVTAEDNIMPHIKTEVSSGRLKIFSEESYTTKVGVKVVVATPALRGLQGDGASKSTVVGARGKHFQLNLSGASECRLKTKAATLGMKLDGGSHANVSGTTQQIDLRSSGASRLEAHDLATKIVKADLSGASSARVNAAEELKVTASGASTLRYGGEPEKLEKNLSGASRVTKE